MCFFLKYTLMHNFNEIMSNYSRNTENNSTDVSLSTASGAKDMFLPDLTEKTVEEKPVEDADLIPFQLAKEPSTDTTSSPQANSDMVSNLKSMFRTNINTNDTSENISTSDTFPNTNESAVNLPLHTGLKENVQDFDNDIEPKIYVITSAALRSSKGNSIAAELLREIEKYERQNNITKAKPSSYDGNETEVASLKWDSGRGETRRACSTPCAMSEVTDPGVDVQILAGNQTLMEDYGKHFGISEFCSDVRKFADSEVEEKKVEAAVVVEEEKRVEAAVVVEEEKKVEAAVVEEEEKKVEAAVVEEEEKKVEETVVVEEEKKVEETVVVEVEEKKVEAAVVVEEEKKVEAAVVEEGEKKVEETFVVEVEKKVEETVVVEEEKKVEEVVVVEGEEKVEKAVVVKGEKKVAEDVLVDGDEIEEINVEKATIVDRTEDEKKNSEYVAIETKQKSSVLVEKQLNGKVVENDISEEKKSLQNTDEKKCYEMQNDSIHNASYTDKWVSNHLNVTVSTSYTEVLPGEKFLKKGCEEYSDNTGDLLSVSQRLPTIFRLNNANKKTDKDQDQDNKKKNDQLKIL